MIESLCGNPAHSTESRGSQAPFKPLGFDYALIVKVCIAIVAIVSVHDALLLVVNHEQIVEFEENPIGSWLLALQGGKVWLFVGAKLIGTSLVITILGELYRRKSQMALMCAVPLAIFQLGLLCYLTLG